MKDSFFDKNYWIEKGVFFKIETFIVREHLSKNESFMVKNSFFINLTKGGARGDLWPRWIIGPEDEPIFRLKWEENS